MNLNPLPESGTKTDFKQRMLDSLPSVPRYPLRPWRMAYPCRLSCLFNGGMALSNLVESILDIILGTCTGWTAFRFGTCLIQSAVVYSTIRGHKRAERRIEASFYDLAATLEQLKSAPDHFEMHLSQRNICKLMANAIRRSVRPLKNDARVRWYNRFHHATRKCSCCLQIVPGYQNSCREILVQRTLCRFPPDCPFCGWYKFNL